jgi:hypothetical protein
MKNETIALDPGAVARVLCGNVTGRNVVAPGPGHSRADRSLSIKIDATAPDGFAATHLRATIGVLAGTMCERRLGSSQGGDGDSNRRQAHYALSLLPQTRTRLAARRWRCDTGAKDAIRAALWLLRISAHAASRCRMT